MKNRKEIKCEYTPDGKLQCSYDGPIYKTPKPKKPKDKKPEDGTSTF